MAEQDKKPETQQNQKAMQYTMAGFVLLVIGIAALLTSTHSAFSKALSLLLLAAAAVLFGISIGVQRKEK